MTPSPSSVKRGIQAAPDPAGPVAVYPTSCEGGRQGAKRGSRGAPKSAFADERGAAVATLEGSRSPGSAPYVAVGHRAGPAPAATCPRPSRSAQPARAPLTHDDYAGPEGHKDPGVEQRQPRHGSSDGRGRIGGT